jgi:CTP synthase
VQKIDAELIEKDGAEKHLTGMAGILVPGGFGYRGIEGKILAAQFARERGVPYLGLCLGMQIATIEFARNVCGLKGANSSEFAPETAHPVICMLDAQRNVTNKGGTMRLGAQLCKLAEGSRAAAAYGKLEISERHRHRYEFNNHYRAQLEAAGLVIAGTTLDGGLVEVIELRDHPWFVAVQFHPEFQSKPHRAHPLFRDFIAHVLGKRTAAAPHIASAAMAA